MYVQGRKYVKGHRKKGGGKRVKIYQQEERNKDNVPESREKLLKFLSDQNRELSNMIKERNEAKLFGVASPTASSDFSEEVAPPVEEGQESFLEESDSEEEGLRDENQLFS